MVASAKEEDTSVPRFYNNSPSTKTDDARECVACARVSATEAGVGGDRVRERVYRARGRLSRFGTPSATAAVERPSARARGI